MYRFIILILATSILYHCKSNKTQTYDTIDPTVESRSNDGSNRANRGDRRGPRSIEEIFKMDTNADGMLSKSEVKGPLLRRFDTIDSNKDGLITKEEYENAPKPKRGQRPARNNG